MAGLGMAAHGAAVSRRLGILAVLAAAISASAVSDASALTSSQKRDMLSPREKTFLNIVFSGDEAKAVEYAQTAGVNPNNIGGESLSTWFYGLGNVANINVQRIVFERFRQKSNPANIGDMEFLGGFCSMPPLPSNIRTEVQGTSAEKEALGQRQENARRAHVDNIMASFQSLLGYGLKDKTILTRIFVGCLSHRMIPKTPEYYDRVFAPMLRAGASIDGNEAYRPLLNAVQDGNAFLVERFIADGADVIYRLPSNFGNTPYGQGPCQPRADQSLYRYVFNYVRSKNEEASLRIIKALALKGLSPMAKWGVDSGACKYTTLYDAVIDTGNLGYAARIKEIAVSVSKQAGQPKPVAQLPATAPVASTQTPVEAPAPVGAWKFIVENGKAIAMTKAQKPDGDHIAGLRLECAGGRLEYVPVALRSAITTLWVDGVDDTLHTIPLTRGRVTGADNVLLSKEFLSMEAIARRDSREAGWGMPMSIDGPEAGMQTIPLAGFSKVRGYMLAHCKS